MKIALALLGIATLPALAQTPSGQSWGQWRAASQPGIQVRAFCQSEARGPRNLGAVSNWQYQLRNTNSFSSDIRWREEHFDPSSRSNRMTSPSSWILPAEKATPVFHATLLGACDKLAAMHIVVLPRATRSTAHRRIHARTGAQPLPRDLAAANTAYTGSPAAPASASENHVPIVPPRDVSIPGSSWQCEWEENRKVDFAITFRADGAFLITRDEGPDKFPGQSEITGNHVTWADAAGRLYTLQVRGDSMIGSTSTLDRMQSRGRDYHGTIACKLSK